MDLLRFPPALPKRRFFTLILLAAMILPLGRPVDAAADDLSGGFEYLRAQDLRLAQVAYRLSVANRTRCAGYVEPQSGLALHGIAQYPASDRIAAAKHFRFDSGIAVMAVVAKSPADVAGIEADDRLIAVNGRVIDPQKVGNSRVAVDAAEALIREELGKGPATLQLARAGKLLELRLSVELGCSLRAELLATDKVNAWANGERVIVSAGLLERFETENELALVVAHELAHNLLGHRERLLSLGVTESGFLRSLGVGSAQIRETEEEADRLGARLAVRAGYDVGEAIAGWSGFLADKSSSSPTHLSGRRRIALLQHAAAEATLAIERP